MKRILTGGNENPTKIKILNWNINTCRKDWIKKR